MPVNRFVGTEAIYLHHYLLPHLEQNAVYQAYGAGNPWLQPQPYNNASVYPASIRGLVLKAFVCPSDGTGRFEGPLRPFRNEIESNEADYCQQEKATDDSSARR